MLYTYSKVTCPRQYAYEVQETKISIIYKEVYQNRKPNLVPMSSTTLCQ